MTEGIPNHFEVIRSLPHGHVMAILETIKKLGLDKITAIPNSNGSVGYRIDFASVPQNRVNELPIGFCRNGSPRFEFYRDAELLPQGYRWHG
jgi:hypothetical protein